MKKTLAIILSVLMLVAALPLSGIAAEKTYPTPASSYTPYNSNAVFEGNYDDLSYDQIAGVILDWLDREIAAVASDFDSFEVDALGQQIAIDLDINGIDDILKYSGYLTQLGGDFASLDTASLSGLSRANGDINFIYGMLQFMADNAATFGKVFSWEAGQTFDFGKVGEYIETLPQEDVLRVFYNDYLIGNNIQQKFTNEIAREMNYTAAEGETLDDVINNGILAIVTDFCKDNDILSDAAIANIKANFNLRATDIYKLIKDFVDVVQSDNQVKIDTYYNFYLDNYVRTALKVMFGYEPKVGTAVTDAAAVEAEFNAVYADLALLYELSDGTVYFRAADGKYYSFTVTAAAITAVNELTWENTLGINFEAPTVGIYTKATGTPDLTLGTYNCALVKDYHPTSENYEMHVYSPYQEQMNTALQGSGLTVEAAAAPEAYTGLMVDANKKAMSDFFAMAVKQGDAVTQSTVVTFEEIEEFAQQAALSMAQSMAAGMGATVKSVDVKLSYDGYATDDEFITNVTASITASAEVTVSGFTIPVNNFDVSSAIQNPVATVVVDNLSGSEGILDAAALFDFVDTDFAIDDSFINFAGNYDAYNGVIGQSNHVLCGLLEMLLTDEGYASLEVVDGTNDNLTDNIQKLCNKANSMITAAKEFMDEENFQSFIDATGISELFSSSHGFNAEMVYNLDFSSVESLYVCAIEMVLDMIDDEQPGLINDIHTAVEGLDTLDQMAVAGADYAIEKGIAAVQDFITDFNTKYGTEFAFDYTLVKTDASTITDNAKDVIMTKLVDLGLNALTFAVDDAANALINKAIDKINDELAIDLGHVDFKLGVTADTNWEATANAMVDRVCDLLNGLLIVAGSIDKNADVFDKLSALAGAVLPLGSMFSNCSTADYVCDFGAISDIIFNEVLSGDFDSFLGMFEAYNAAENNKPADIANGVSVNYALIKSSDYIVDAFFPSTVSAELYTDSVTVQDSFTSSESDAGIAARNMTSINARKLNLVPAALDIAKESDILKSLVPPCEHTNTETVAATPATCLTAGYEAGVRCTDCGKWISGHEEIAALGHNMVITSNTAATCTADGAVVSTCSRCSETTTIVLKATGHDWEWKTDTAATCGTAGTQHQECKKCHATQAANSVIPATGNHTYGAPVVTPATCTANGFSVTTCTVCSHTTTQVLNATGHTDANGDYTCDSCGAQLEKPEEKQTFIQKIQAFFQKIIDFFKNLFG